MEREGWAGVKEGGREVFRGGVGETGVRWRQLRDELEGKGRPLDHFSGGRKLQGAVGTWKCRGDLEFRRWLGEEAFCADPWFCQHGRERRKPFTC